jgi:DNA-binding NtrC family response regulator
MKPMKILIAEDDASTCEILELSICYDNPNVQCIFSHTVEESITKYDKHLPDVVLMDYWLADGVADSFITHIKEHPNKAKKVILLSGIQNIDVVADQFNISYLKKPYKFEDLQRCVFSSNSC